MKRLFLACIHLLLTISLVQISRPALAQQDTLFISAILLPDTIYEGISYDSLVKVSIQNKSQNTTFSGNITILMAQDTSGSNIDTLLSVTQQTIAPGAILTLSPNAHFFDPFYYKTGGNTVVVWPISAFATVVDSFHTGFFYIPSSGIHLMNHPSFDFRLMPNPVQDHLILISEESPEQVRIFSSDGRLVYNKPGSRNGIETNNLEPGIYLLECRFKNQKSVFNKFLKLK